jgi:hypothetical protein
LREDDTPLVALTDSIIFRTTNLRVVQKRPATFG